MAEKDTTRLGQSIQESTPSSGRNTIEYESVKKNLNCITKQIRRSPSAWNTLRQKYIEKGWLDETAETTVEQLVEFALGRIEQNIKEYNVFVSILHSIPGMDLILNILSETAPHHIISSGSQAHSMAAVVEQLRTTSVREERPIEGNHEAKSYAIQEHFTEIHEFITPHINIIVDEARRYKLISYMQMVKFTSAKHTRKEVAREFLKYIEQRTRRGDSIACDTFLVILQLPKLSLAEAAKMIKITVQGEVWRKSKQEANAPEQFKPESDSGVLNNTGTADSEQLSSFHSEAYSEPAPVESDPLSPVGGASHHNVESGSMDTKEYLNPGSSIGTKRESNDGDITPQTAEDIGGAEDEEGGHPQSRLSRDVIPVSETTAQSQTQNGSKMVKQDVAVYTYSETQLMKENDILLSENKELKEKCMKLQQEVGSKQTLIEELSEELKQKEKCIDRMQKIIEELSVV